MCFFKTGSTQLQLNFPSLELRGSDQFQHDNEDICVKLSPWFEKAGVEELEHPTQTDSDSTPLNTAMNWNTNCTQDLLTPHQYLISLTHLYLKAHKSPNLTKKPSSGMNREHRPSCPDISVKRQSQKNRKSIPRKCLHSLLSSHPCACFCLH